MDEEGKYDEIMENLVGESYVPLPVMAKHLAVTVTTLKRWIKEEKISSECLLVVGSTYRIQPEAAIRSLRNYNEERDNG